MNSSDVSSDTPNQKSLCSHWLQNKTVKHILQPPDSPSLKCTCCDITHIWMQDSPNITPLPLSLSFHCCPPPSSHFYPRQHSRLSFLSACFHAPALRDEREEPLAHACDHHHHCDWCHSDCCLGDGGSFAEQASPPKVQGMATEK